MRRGFTMVETMVAAAIGAIALLAIGSSFMASVKMLHVAMAESELSLAMREMREKLLFKASPDVSGNHYGGLLSGTELNEGGVRGYNSVEMAGHTVGSTLGTTSDSSLRLLVWTVGNDKLLINERTPNKDAYVRWLWPGSMVLVKWANPEEDVSSMSDLLNYSARNSNGSNIYRLDFDIALAAKVRRGDGSRIVRKEQVSVPVLGKFQPLKDTE
jgi:prepilin-type N-terminal cleavage/methylation domain-containing protein